MNGSAFVWRLLLGANVVWFAWMWMNGVSPIQPEGLERFGALHGPLVAAGDAWRLFTCMFVHVGFVHLLFNMYALSALGPIVERVFGNAAFLLLYLLSGVGGSLASVVWRPAGSSAGASGAIFGLLGALLAFSVRHRRDEPSGVARMRTRVLLLLIGVNIAIGFTVPMVDNAGHVGGLCVGIVSGIALDRNVRETPRLTRRRFARAAIVGILLAIAVPLAITRVLTHPRAGAFTHEERARRALLADDVVTAAREAQAALERDPQLAIAAAILAEAHASQGEIDLALVDCDRAVANDPEAPHPRFLRGWLRFARGDLEMALEDLDRAVHLSPDADAYRLVRGQLLAAMNRFEDARREFVLAASASELAAEADAWTWLCVARHVRSTNARIDLGAGNDAVVTSLWAAAMAPSESRANSAIESLVAGGHGSAELQARSQVFVGELALANELRELARERFDRAAQLFERVNSRGAEALFVNARLRALGAR